MPAHVSPPPKPAKAIRSPGFTVPLCNTSSKRIATLAAEVLPYLSRLTGKISSLRCNLLAAN